MQIHDPCPVQVLKTIDKALKKQPSVSFDEVVGSSSCRRFSVRDIGIALELLRRNGLVRATSRFGCSELLEFTATGVTEEGKAFLSSHR